MVNLQNLSHSFVDEFDNFVLKHPAYGYGPQHGSLSPGQCVIHRIRQQDYSRLHPSPDAQPHGITPLDHAGSALYAESQLNDVFQELQTSMLQNPHSASQAGALPTQHRQELAQLTLEMCNASPQDYEVVLTAGATASMKLVAESLPWGPSSQLLYLRQTHNSVLGMREYVLRAGGSVQVADLADNSINPSLQHHLKDEANKCSLQDSTEKQPSNGKVSHPPTMLLKAVGPVMRRVQHNQQAVHFEANQVPRHYTSHSQSNSSAIQLAILPHECNFTGQRLNLELVNTIQSGSQFMLPTVTADGQHVNDDRNYKPRHCDDHGANCSQGTNHQSPALHPPTRWLVMLDAAKSCSTGPPNLSKNPADLVALSYYKIFGYPTGLGALLVRKQLLPLMTAQKPYFGGGTVAASCAEEDWFARRPGASGLEDGTQAFTSVAAARHGFKYLRQLGWFPAIQAHTRALTEYLVKSMASLTHPNGQPLVVFYGRPNKEDDVLPGDQFPGIDSWGPTVPFNLKRADGSWIGYNEVNQLAALHGIHLRVGCFCNPGACAKYLNLSGAEMRENYEAGHVCWDDRDIMHGKPTGAVRVSLGYISMFQDVHYFVRFLKHYFLTSSQKHLSLPAQQQAAVSQPAAVELLAPYQELDVLDRIQHSKASCKSSSQQEAHDLSRASHARISPLGESANGSAVNVSESVHNQSAVKPQQAYPGQLIQSVNGQHEDGIEHVTDSTNTTPLASNGGSFCHNEEVAALPQGQDQLGSPARLSAMYVYPIKSCAAQQVTKWPVGPTGLLYDREWALVDDQGQVVTQKACPQAALVVPNIDLTTNILTISAPSSVSQPLVIPLTSSMQQHIDNNAAQPQRVYNSIDVPIQRINVQNNPSSSEQVQANSNQQQPPVLISQPSTVGAARHQFVGAGKGVTHVNVCGDQVCGSVVVSELTEGSIRAWFKAAIGIPCTLVRQQQGQRAARPGTGGTGRYGTAERQKMSQQTAELQNSQVSTQENQLTDAKALIGFANDGQFLLVNAASVQDVNDRMQSITRPATGGEFKPVDVNRFRPNLVVTGLQPYAEDEWKHVQVGSLKCDVLGTCPRCEMLQVDQKNGVRGRPDVLLALAQYRRFNGRMHFGILLSSALSNGSAGQSCDEAGSSNSSGTLLLSVGDVIVGDT